ncbi:phage tail protein [Enterobacter sp. JMULE2]|nr:tail protein X [Enterobacter sp. JMULE2]NTZ37815.1 phage tail protein [Enterobacter sp. JMULE2]
MAKIYTTRAGDMLDEICWRFYGAEQEMIAVLEANPGLAELGDVYPAGIKITLPDKVATPVMQAETLWS